MTTGGKQVLGYVRCSTYEQAADGLGLETQENRIRAWAQAMGAGLVDVVVDAGVSGTKPLASRAGGSLIHTLLHSSKPQADAVVVLRLDRLGRWASATVRSALLAQARLSPVSAAVVA